MTPAACEQHHQIALCRLPNSIGRAVGERRVRISRIGGLPKNRLYSRLNWLALSYPTSKAALAASRPSMSMRPRVACNRKPKVFPVLKRTHRGQRTEMVVQRGDAHARDLCEIFHPERL